jgi:signal transduction histidine kinase
VSEFEQSRLQALLGYRVLDTPADPAFDRLTALASDLFDAPIALVSLVDDERQWFKSRVGLDECETPRDQAFCAHAIKLDPGAVMVVEDATQDPRFLDNPLVTGAPGIRFYAGAVLTSADGHNLGTLCVIDTKARPEGLSHREANRLRALAQVVIDELELARTTRKSVEKRRLLSLAEAVSGVGHWRHVIKTGEVRWSDEVYRIHGVTRETFDPAFNAAVEFYGPEERATLDALILSALATGEGYDFEMNLRRADGETRVVVCRAVCELDENGAVEAMFGVFQDVTEHVDALRAAQTATVAKAEFLANISHELRTPLTSILGFSNLLKQSDGLASDERRYADRIQTASQALLSVINDILDVSKLEAGGVELDPRPFDVMQLAREAMELIEPQAQAKGLTLKITGGGLDGLLVGDGPRLRQVMLNFLSNAAKFTARGAITLDARGEPDGQGGVRLAVCVTDTGIGFAPEQAERLFERFVQADGSTTRDYGGTGLGLTISQRLIEMMDGDIGAIGRPGQGATFWFTVPLNLASGGAAIPAHEASRPRLVSARVLLADDAAANRELVGGVLTQLGLDVESVEDGAAAVHAVSRGDFDLVLMDIHMPGMDGLAATRAIRAMGGRFADLPILALTANVEPCHLKLYAEAGLDGHIAKPIDFGALVSELVSHLPAPPLGLCA